jgi:arsenate reductase
MAIKVLFLCTGNSARSQMAEALLRHHAGDRFEAFSAGTDPRPLNPLTLQVLEEKGVSTAGLRSKDLSEYLGREFFSYVVVVCSRAAEKCPTAWPGVHEVLHLYFDDPAAATGSDEEKLARFREVRDQLEAALLEWVARLDSNPAAGPA